MVEEIVEYSGRAEPRERWLKALPLLVSLVIGIPFLVLAIMFSWQFSQLSKYIFDLGTSGLEATGLVLLSMSGGLCAVIFLVFLFIGTRHRTWKWRVWWAAAAFFVAAIMPLWWLVAGFF